MLERQRPIEALRQAHSATLSPQQSAFVLTLGCYSLGQGGAAWAGLQLPPFLKGKGGKDSQEEGI